MRVDRPTPTSYPITYDDDGEVLSDPNREQVDVAARDEDRPKPPPLGGRGSSVQAWRRFAKDVVGLADADRLDRDEIVAQLRSVGIVPSRDEDGDDTDATNEAT